MIKSYKKLLLSIAVSLFAVSAIAQDVNVTIHNETAGQLNMALIEAGYSLPTITSLTVTGVINETDLMTIKGSMISIYEVDLSNCQLDGGSIPSQIFKGQGSWDKYQLRKFSFPNNVSLIGGQAFQYSNLSGTLVLPNEIKELRGYGIFYYTDITSIIWPDNLEFIGNGCFAFCFGLSGSLKIPSSVSTIFTSAFISCKNITELQLPNTNISIHNEAFMNCEGLVKVTTLNPTPIILGSNVFEGVDKTTCELIVPFGSKTAYMLAPQWGGFVNIREASEEGYHNVTTNYNHGGIISNNGSNVISGQNTSIEHGFTTSFTISANLGYSLTSVLYNGAEVIDQLVDGTYTTPAVEADATLEVIFEKEQYKLCIKSADNGTTNLLCHYGDVFSFDFTPAGDWEFSTVSFNNNDVTSTLTNGVFTTPEITGDSNIDVVFTTATTMSAEQTSPINIYSTSHAIIVEGLQYGETIDVYNVSGAKVSTVTAEGSATKITPSKNSIYIVKTKNKTAKVAL